ncbi:MAG: ABC transporter ATP-binding protein [Actinomycetaceae bacterium]|nr:ABC transporter ATP-binding protein [Actinomycetaceae bacterium]
MGLSVRGVDVFYGDMHAVKDVSFDLPTGQVLALLGASGSGKSSLLRAVAGLEPAHGLVEFAGEDVSDVPVHRRGFGLMFQDGQLFPHRSVAGNVAFGLRGFLPRSQWAARVDELLDLVGLPGFGGRSVGTLSGGQAQRVALARALAPSPRVLLLDEPLSALDRSLREQLAVDIRRIVHATGVCALYVTHDQDEAFSVADLVGVMDEGALRRLGAPAEVWGDPGTVRVSQFLGYSPLLSPTQAAEWGVRLSSHTCLACAPGAFRASTTGGCAQVVSPEVAEGVVHRRVPVLESRTVRGGQELTVDVGGLQARVELPLDTAVSSHLEVFLDPASCVEVVED